MEIISEKDIKDQAISYIATIISQAKEINRTTNPTIKSYSVDAAKNYIDNVETQVDSARGAYDKLKDMPEAHFWTVGRNKAKTEQTQKVLEYTIEAVDNNANATKVLFNNQIILANASKQLYALGLMGIASNRIVMREIRLRLNNASKEELDELAMQELKTILAEIEKQQGLEDKIENIIQTIGQEDGEKPATGIKLQIQTVEREQNRLGSKIDEVSQSEHDHYEVVCKEIGLFKQIIGHEEDEENSASGLLLRIQNIEEEQNLLKNAIVGQEKINDQLEEIKNTIQDQQTSVSSLSQKIESQNQAIEHLKKKLMISYIVSGILLAFVFILKFI